jgi:hypothetical protein
MKKTKFLYAFAITALLFQGCKKDNLDVQNTNNPDFAKVYSSGADLENLTSGLYNTIFQGDQFSAGVIPMLTTASDNMNCSWGNFGMRDMSFEPRDNAWDNSPSYSYNTQTKFFFDKMYASINTASNVLKAINGGVNIGDAGADNARAKAFCKFAQGVAYGNLGLVFDKAFIVDENITIANPSLAAAVPYTTISAKALTYLDEAIALCAANTFTIPKAWLGTAADMSSADFKKLLNTSAARILSYTPRNKTQLTAVDWAKVKTYADAGITSDFAEVMDGTTKWYFEAADYLLSDGWGVTDMYVVNMMDPTKPAHWDDNAAFPYPTASTSPIDARLTTDYAYIGSNWFQTARGYYHFSAYRSKRYDDVFVARVGSKAEIMKAENDMLKAEARVYTNDLSGAAAIINASTRKTRGLMADVAGVTADLVKAIHHERHVEMHTTSLALQFCEMRKLNLLQKGTPLHLPLPAKTLETFGETLPFYTFGKLATQDGINTSNAGWR